MKKLLVCISISILMGILVACSSVPIKGTELNPVN